MHDMRDIHKFKKLKKQISLAKKMIGNQKLCLIHKLEKFFVI